MSDAQLDGAPFITNREKKHGTWPIPPSLKAKMKERDELEKSIAAHPCYPFGEFVYPYNAGECVDPSYSGVPTESEIEEAHITLETAGFKDALDAARYAAQMRSVLEKARQPSRWQRFVRWLRDLFVL